jgi:hypothetical protein
VHDSHAGHISRSSKKMRGRGPGDASAPEVPTTAGNCCVGIDPPDNERSGACVRTSPAGTVSLPSTEQLIRLLLAEGIQEDRRFCCWAAGHLAPLTRPAQRNDSASEVRCTASGIDGTLHGSPQPSRWDPSKAIARCSKMALGAIAKLMIDRGRLEWAAARAGLDGQVRQVQQGVWEGCGATASPPPQAAASPPVGGGGVGLPYAALLRYTPEAVSGENKLLLVTRG